MTIHGLGEPDRNGGVPWRVAGCGLRPEADHGRRVHRPDRQGDWGQGEAVSIDHAGDGQAIGRPGTQKLTRFERVADDALGSGGGDEAARRGRVERDRARDRGRIDGAGKGDVEAGRD